MAMKDDWQPIADSPKGRATELTFADSGWGC